MVSMHIKNKGLKNRMVDAFMINWGRNWGRNLKLQIIGVENKKRKARYLLAFRLVGVT